MNDGSRQFKELLKSFGQPDNAPVKRIFLEQEQVELSACSLAANTNALAKSYKAGLLTDADLDFISRLPLQKSAEPENPDNEPGLSAASFCACGLVLRADIRPVARQNPSNRKKVMNIPKTQEERDEMLLKGLSGLEEKFETREKNSETLLKNFDQLDKTTKESVKDLELLKKNANDTALILKQIQTIQKNLRNEAVVAGLDPITRIEKNPLLRQHLNLFCRKSVNQKGEFNSQIELIQKAIGEDTGEGATLIIAQLYKEIYDTLAEYGDWSTLGVRRVGTKVTNFPVKTARPVALFLTSEATPIADDGNYAGSTITQTVLPIAVLLNVSKQLLEDAEFDVTALIMDDFQEAWNYRLDYACFLGNGGTTLDGGFTGMFNGGTGYAAAAGGVGGPAHQVRRLEQGPAGGRSHRAQAQAQLVDASPDALPSHERQG